MCKRTSNATSTSGGHDRFEVVDDGTFNKVAGNTCGEDGAFERCDLSIQDDILSDGSTSPRTSCPPRTWTRSLQRSGWQDIVPGEGGGATESPYASSSSLDLVQDRWVGTPLAADLWGTPPRPDTLNLIYNG